MTPLGVGQQAEAVYRVALAETKWATDVLVSLCEQEARLSEAEIREAVVELVALQLLQPSAELPDTQLRVVAPTVALEARLGAYRETVQERQRELDRAADGLANLQEQYARAREARIDETIERLVGLDAVRSRLEELAQEAQLEALAFMRGSQSAESMEASWPLDRDALSRGVNLRSVYLHSALNDPASSSYMRRLAEAGAENRTVATLPLRLLIIDRATAVIPVDPEFSRAGALVVRSKGAVAALLALFESVWLGARRVGEPRVSATVETSDTEREILRILATGAIDDVVARQLGVSVRTVRRMTSVLMNRFQAQSRFELGLRLGQQGWGRDSDVSTGDGPDRRQIG